MLHHHESELSFVAYVIAAAVLVGAIIISGTIYFTGRSVFGVGGIAQNAQATGDEKVTITLPNNVPYLGNPKAKVTVIEYADYRCPFCEQYFKTVMPDIQAKYIDTGKIKFVYQDVAFLGPDSLTAGQGAYCATEQGKFWQFHDYMFAHQGDESTTWANAANEKTMAASMGLDVAAFSTCLDSGKYAKQVTDDTITAQKYGVDGTPTTFINGMPIKGAQDPKVFEQAIEDALK